MLLPGSVRLTRTRSRGYRLPSARNVLSVFTFGDGSSSREWLICTVVIAAPGCLAVCVLGMAWRCVSEPHRAVLVVDHVADAAATSDLVLSLLQVAAVVPVRGQVAAEPVLTVVAGSRARVGA